MSGLDRIGPDGQATQLVSIPPLDGDWESTAALGAYRSHVDGCVLCQRETSATLVLCSIGEQRQADWLRTLGRRTP